jgi:hypothetical protein
LELSKPCATAFAAGASFPPKEVAVEVYDKALSIASDIHDAAGERIEVEKSTGDTSVPPPRVTRTDAARLSTVDASPSTKGQALACLIWHARACADQRSVVALRLVLKATTIFFLC